MVIKYKEVKKVQNLRLPETNQLHHQLLIRIHHPNTTSPENLSKGKETTFQSKLPELPRNQFQNACRMLDLLWKPKKPTLKGTSETSTYSNSRTKFAGHLSNSSKIERCKTTNQYHMKVERKSSKSSNNKVHYVYQPNTTW